MAPFCGTTRFRGLARDQVAFTLIELLVVITIVTVLLTMILPSLSSARQVAKDTQCKARMRQMFQLSEVYRGDWKQYYPVGTMLTGQPLYNPPASMWYYFQIEPYLNVARSSLMSRSNPQNNMLMCPASSYSPAMGSAVARVHIYAESLYGNYWPSARFGYNASGTAYPIRREILSPFDTILLGETKGVQWNRMGHSSGMGNSVNNHSLDTTYFIMGDGRLAVTTAIYVSSSDSGMNQLNADGLYFK